MADTCIVCLGDLSFSENEPSDPADATSNALSSRVANDGILAKVATNTSFATEPEIVAHLLPCGHNLHNECLKPWVERANSCPICRASFSQVELSKYIGGPVIDTYAVQDKQQQAEIDPSMVVDDDLFDEQHNEACMVCESYGELMLCDGCNQACHVACADLEEVPSGAWFCYDCMADPQMLQNATASRTRPAPRQRTTAAHASRRAPRQATQQSHEWARVWREVHQRIDLDLEFPFEESGEDVQRVEIERLLHDERMRRRRRVAERVGAGRRFEAAVAAIQPPQPDPESQENLRAWNIFDKQIQLDEDHDDSELVRANNRRKRKSPTASPAEPQQAEAARPLKRPRTRREQNTTPANGEPSAAAARASPPPPTAEPQPSRDEPSTIPTFLQSLLKEVETKPSATASEAASPQPELAHSPLETSLSPRPSSPELSPQSSNHPTPRMMTPPPLSSPRPSSPAALTSVISPVYPQAPEFSPYSPLEEDSIERARGRPRRQQHPDRGANANSSPETSPSRGGGGVGAGHHSSLSYSTKSEIQRMVRSELRPLYNDKRLTKDEYTDVNRDVSRLLYDKVEGSSAALEDEKERYDLQKVAHEEVDRAVKALREQSPILQQGQQQQNQPQQQVLDGQQEQRSEPSATVALAQEA